MSLRERKKRALREQLSVTTVLLARERGLRNVRVEDIVERVGVSRRTFGNYFASKEDAIADRHVQRAEVAAGLLADRPAAEPLWSAVTAAVFESFAGHDEPQAPSSEQQSGLYEVLADPDLQSAIDRGARAATTALAAAIAERIGASEGDPRPRLVANAALTTVLVILEFWVAHPESGPVQDLLRAGFAQLGDGLDRLCDRGIR